MPLLANTSFFILSRYCLSGFVSFEGWPFGGLDYVAYLCCANCYNSNSLIYVEFWTYFLWLGAWGFCASWKTKCLSVQAAGPGVGVFGEREVRVEVDTSVQLRSISRKFWRFW